MLSLQLLSTHPRISLTTKISPSQFKQETISCRARNRTYISHHCWPSSSTHRFCLAAAANDSIIPPEEEISAIQLPDGLRRELMPKHVAVIMDGNRRWAKNRMLPVQLGHRAGAKALEKLALNCSKLGIEVLSVFAFSTENWTRPKNEVDFLMSLFEETIKSEFEELIRNNIQVSCIGDKSRLPHSLRSMMSSIEESTKANKGMRCLVAVNYGGRYDITNASKKIAEKVRDGFMQVEDINEALFEKHLETSGVKNPNPDLVIRTSGEFRISNFLIWQLAYSELCFVDKLFPDFQESDLLEAIKIFQQRDRRYGGKKH